MNKKIVICINNGFINKMTAEGGLIEGKEYTVLGETCDGQHYILEGVDINWNKQRFKDKIEFILPKNWYVVITEGNRGKVKKWYQQFSSGNFSITACYGISSGSYQSRIASTAIQLPWVEITTEQFEQFILKEQPKEIIGFKCIKAYPGYELGKEVIGGKTDTWDRVLFYNFPSYWEPIYKSNSIKTLELGNPKRTIVIYKDKIEACGRVFTSKELINLSHFESKLNPIGDISTEVKIIDYTLQIGCKTEGTKLIQNELNQILITQNSL